MEKEKNKKVSEEEEEKMNKLLAKLIWRRGEIIHWVSEIESKLDEIIIDYFVKENKKIRAKLFEMMLWEDFRLFTKIRMFREVEVPSKVDKIKEKTLKDLDKIISNRNKFAHRLSLITLDKAYLIDKKHKSIEISDEFFKDIIEKSKKTLDNLKTILLIQKGIDPSALSKGEKVWIKIKDIK